MCNQCRISYKFQELRKDSFNISRIHHHLIGNGRKLGNTERNRSSWIHKGTELLRNFSMFYFHCTNFYDSICRCGKSGCLYIKYHIGVIQCLFFYIHGNFRQVIHQISFYSVNNLERIVLIQTFDIMIRLSKCLHYPMVRNGNCRMSPVMCPFYQRSRI